MANPHFVANSQAHTLALEGYYMTRDPNGRWIVRDVDTDREVASGDSYEKALSNGVAFLAN